MRKFQKEGLKNSIKDYEDYSKKIWEEHKRDQKKLEVTINYYKNKLKK